MSGEKQAAIAAGETVGDHLTGGAIAATKSFFPGFMLRWYHKLASRDRMLFEKNEIDAFKAMRADLAPFCDPEQMETRLPKSITDCWSILNDTEDLKGGMLHIKTIVPVHDLQRQQALGEKTSQEYPLSSNILSMLVRTSSVKVGAKQSIAKTLFGYIAKVAIEMGEIRDNPERFRVAQMLQQVVETVVKTQNFRQTFNTTDIEILIGLKNNLNVFLSQPDALHEFDAIPKALENWAAYQRNLASLFYKILLIFTEGGNKKHVAVNYELVTSNILSTKSYDTHFTYDNPFKKMIMALTKAHKQLYEVSRRDPVNLKHLALPELARIIRYLEKNIRKGVRVGHRRFFHDQDPLLYLLEQMVEEKSKSVRWIDCDNYLDQEEVKKTADYLLGLAYWTRLHTIIASIATDLNTLAQSKGQVWLARSEDAFLIKELIHRTTSIIEASMAFTRKLQDFLIPKIRQDIGHEHNALNLIGSNIVEEETKIHTELKVLLDIQKRFDKLEEKLPDIYHSFFNNIRILLLMVLDPKVDQNKGVSTLCMPKSSLDFLESFKSTLGLDKKFKESASRLEARMSNYKLFGTIRDTLIKYAEKHHYLFCNIKALPTSLHYNGTDVRCKVADKHRSVLSSEKHDRRVYWFAFLFEEIHAMELPKGSGGSDKPVTADLDYLRLCKIRDYINAIEKNENKEDQVKFSIDPSTKLFKELLNPIRMQINNHIVTPQEIDEKEEEHVRVEGGVSDDSSDLPENRPDEAQFLEKHAQLSSFHPQPSRLSLVLKLMESSHQNADEQKDSSRFWTRLFGMEAKSSLFFFGKKTVQHFDVVAQLFMQKAQQKMAKKLKKWKKNPAPQVSEFVKQISSKVKDQAIPLHTGEEQTFEPIWDESTHNVLLAEVQKKMKIDFCDGESIFMHLDGFLSMEQKLTNEEQEELNAFLLQLIEAHASLSDKNPKKALYRQQIKGLIYLGANPLQWLFEQATKPLLDQSFFMVLEYSDRILLQLLKRSKQMNTTCAYLSKEMMSFMSAFRTFSKQLQHDLKTKKSWWRRLLSVFFTFKEDAFEERARFLLNSLKWVQTLLSDKTTDPQKETQDLNEVAQTTKQMVETYREKIAPRQKQWLGSDGSTQHQALVTAILSIEQKQGVLIQLREMETSIKATYHKKSSRKATMQFPLPAEKSPVPSAPQLNTGKLFQPAAKVPDASNESLPPLAEQQHVL